MTGVPERAARSLFRWRMPCLPMLCWRRVAARSRAALVAGGMSYHLDDVAEGHLREALALLPDMLRC